MAFNLCSSAGVHGVLVRLFLAGGGPMSAVGMVGAVVVAIAGGRPLVGAAMVVI